MRWLLLWILRPGEDIALNYFAGLAARNYPAGAPALVLPAQLTIELDGSVEEAMRLAFVFRALAAALTALADEPVLPAPMCHALAVFRDLMAASPVEIFDSS